MGLGLDCTNFITSLSGTSGNLSKVCFILVSLFYIPSTFQMELLSPTLKHCGELRKFTDTQKADNSARRPSAGDVVPFPYPLGRC